MKVVTIGRSPECDFVIKDPYVGRTHLQLVVDNGKYYCVDLNSKNGTFVNGRQITGKVQVDKNDIIRIGNTTLPWQQYIDGLKSKSKFFEFITNNFLKIVFPCLLVMLVCGGICFFSEHKNHKELGEKEFCTTDGGTYTVDYSTESIVKNPNIRNIIKYKKPTTDLILYDLIGHKLSEGVSDGYHKQDWTYEIKNNSISSFYIKKTLEDNGNSYVVVASCRLKGGTNSNFYYDTELKIGYINKGNGWKLNYVNSLGMNIVSDGQYNDCILCSLVDDGWGGVNCLNIRNTSECSLVVAGQIRTYNEWKKFSTIVSPHKSASVGGTFGGGNVKDYIIDFVVREQ